MYIADYKPFCVTDGVGIRHSVYVSGCTLNCPNCFNKASQNFKYGTPYSQELECKIKNDLSHDFIEGLSILGGEPFDNIDLTLILCNLVPESKNIWIWSGYTFEELLYLKNDKVSKILNLADVLVDGRYEENLKGNYKFRGSSNQRIINLNNHKPIC